METSSQSPSHTTPTKEAFPKKSLEVGDIVVLVLYFVFVMLVGLWSMWRTKRSTVKGYFLAGKDMVWWPVGASLFASNVGSGHFIGLAGSGAASGIGVTAYEWNGLFCVLVLAWLFLPIYISSGVTTMPEYLQRRFGGKRIQIFLAILYLFIYIFTKISVDMYAGALFIQQALHWDLYVAVTALLVITAIYTVAGGLAAVIYTDTLQTIIMIIGAVILMVYSFIEVGGYDALEEQYFNAIPKSHTGNSSCGMPREDAFHIFRDPVTSDLPWPGILVGMTITSLWYWCTDQRVLRVPGDASACVGPRRRGGPPVLAVCPARWLRLPGGVCACVSPAVAASARLRGLMMSVMIAALMSSLTSIFNSASTIFTLDLWRHCRPRSSEWELMIVGRAFVLVLVAVSIMWIPLVQASQGGQLFTYIQSISSYLQPPVAMVFIAGCFWKRTNEKGAFWGLTIGLAVGIIRMALDFIYVPPQCDQPDTRPGVVKYVHYLYFSMILGLLTMIIVVVISLCTEPPSKEMVSRLTWSTRWDPVTQSLEEEATGNSVVENGVTVAQNGVSLAENTPDRTDTSSTDGIINNSTEDVPSAVSRLKKAILWICGMDSKVEDTHDQAPSAPPEPAEVLLHEPFVVKQLLNANLIICMSAAVFLWAYFG
ncbi:hypothetical protein FKM82_002951 [Ascaphus truei]